MYSIAFILASFLADFSIDSFDGVIFGLYRLFKVVSCKSIIIKPLGFFIIKPLSSKNFRPSLIVFTDNSSFFDKSFIFTSFLNFERKAIYK